MNEIKQNSPYAWFLAARPKTLTGAIIPVIAGQCPCLQPTDSSRPHPPCCAPSLPAACRLPPTLSTTSSTSRKGPTVREDRLGPQRACARRLDYAGSHESRHRHRTRHSVVPGRAWQCCSHVWEAAAPRRLGTGGAGRGVHTVCFPLYHACSPIGAGATYWC